jgi:hypothetical protein
MSKSNKLSVLPITIKYKRDKKYTEKRTPYKSYQKASWNWTKIFNDIENIKTTDIHFIKTISKKYNINYGTLKNKYNKHCKNPKNDFNKEHRGGINKIFSLKEEKKLFDIIKKDYINKNRPLTNEILKELALNLFSLSKEKKENECKFNASNGWCTIFKKKWNLSTQKTKNSKISTNIPSKYKINEFLNKCDSLRTAVNKTFFLIMMR